MKKVYRVWKEDENSKSKVDRHEKLEQKINQIFYRGVKREFKKEINIIHILAFAQVGMSEFDLERITAWAHPQSNIGFGDWRKFLNKVVLNPEQEEDNFEDEIDVSKDSTKTPLLKSQNSLKMSKADTIGQLEEIREEVEMSDGEVDAMNGGKQGPWTIKMA